MAILIDPPLWPAHGRLWSHLVSDASFDELHRFARAAGVPARGFEGDHYDVPQERYEALVAAGARPVSGRELLHRLRHSGLRRPKRRGERVVASHAAAPGVRVDALLSSLPPAQAVTGVRVLVAGRRGVLAVPHGADWVLPQVDVPPGTGHRPAELAARLAGPLAGERWAALPRWHQVGYLRRQAPAGGVTAVAGVDLVLRRDDTHAARPVEPARWLPRAAVRQEPPLGALLDALLADQG